jgi:hypothetical protein
VNHNDAVNDTALRQLAERLGTRAAERLDVERTAEAVVTRLRQEPRGAGRVWAAFDPAWLRIAAALVLVVGAGLVARGAFQPAPLSEPALAVPGAGPELSELSAPQLEELLRTVAEPGGARDAGAAPDVGLEDLSAPQLRALLASLEG